MIKRILVALDRDIDTPVAIKYAIKLAQNFEASVSGLAVVDTPQIASQTAGGSVDIIKYTNELRKQMTEESRQQAGDLLQNFDKLVTKAGAKHAALMEEGVPFERIIEYLKYHDLLIIGRESHFFYNRPEQETKTLAKIIKKSTAPTLVVTESYRDVNRVAVAHDGSAASARALQWFVQLEPYGRDIEIDLVHVCNTDHEKTADKGNFLLHLVHDYLKAHNYNKVNEQLIDKKGSIGETILGYIKESGIDLVVLGAHSMAAIRRITFGSTTHDLVKNSPVLLFLSH